MKSAYDGEGRFVFFSYSHQDEGLVGPFFDALSEKFKVWHDRDIDFGSDWNDVILNHIKKSCLFLFCVTPNSLSSEYCKKEVKTAIDNEIAFLSVIINQLDEGKMSAEFKKMYEQSQACNLFEYNNYKEAVIELARRNAAINIALREEYQKKDENKKGDFKKTLANTLPRNKNDGIRAIGSFEDLSRLMNSDYSMLDDLEFATSSLPKEIFDRCDLQQNINSKFRFLLGVCYYLGIGTEVNIVKAANNFFLALSENVGLPKNMFNKALWALVDIYQRIMFERDNYNRIDMSSISRIAEGDLVDIYNCILDYDPERRRQPRKTPEQILDEINDSKNLTSGDRKFLLAKFHLIISRNMHLAEKYYDEAIAEGSEVGVVFKAETQYDIVKQMEFRMLRGYSQSYTRYAVELKKAEKFNLTDEEQEQYNYCLNSARLGNIDAIKDINETFYLGKNKNPLGDSLMNFLFDQGVEKGSRELIKIQLDLLNNEKGLFKKHAKRQKALLKLDKAYLALAKQIESFLDGFIKDFFEKNNC